MIRSVQLPVHGVCGIWGILAVALLGKPELLPLPFLKQLGAQALGTTIYIV